MGGRTPRCNGTQGLQCYRCRERGLTLFPLRDELGLGPKGR
jgi:hypothetical protein